MKDRFKVNFSYFYLIYKITDFLGDGTFGRVLEVKDLKYNEYYAMKVIRSVKRYIESAEVKL